MNDDPNLIELLAPAVGGRIETLTGLPLTTIGERLDDGTATVATLTVILAVLADATIPDVLEAWPTVYALRQAAVTAVLGAAQTVLTAAAAAGEGVDGG